ncbi:MAG: histidine--tRNA ligase [Bacteroidales bacterium]
MAQKPSIPSGTRDFTPSITLKRNQIFDTIKSVFKVFGFEQIETPAMENLSTLLGKYGDEGDKLLFKILNSGEAFSKVEPSELSNSSATALKVCEKGLRYDLTVPFARYVVQHQNEIAFPFRRFQIQPVWRADRPQKGRYREFYQCDVDIVGSTSLLNEVELIQIVSKVYKELKIKTILKINNRKILSGIAELMNAPDKLIDITVAIDKMDKIGIDNVNDELRQKGIDQKGIDALAPILNLQGSNQEKLKTIKKLLKNSEEGSLGVQEMQTIFDYLEKIELDCCIDFDLSLARGLSYYTGTIFEVKAEDVNIGSITGGGRYDNLTGVFGLPNVSGVGISFGVDRIYDVMEELKAFKEKSLVGTQVLFVNLGKEEEEEVIKLASKLRTKGIPTEIYPEAKKINKQFDYANKRNIPFVAVVGETELAKKEVQIKNMKSGKQTAIAWADLSSFFAH